MARASAQDTEKTQTFGMDGEMVFLTMPISAYKALADAAKARGKTVGQALQEALADYLKEA